VTVIPFDQAYSFPSCPAILLVPLEDWAKQFDVDIHRYLLWTREDDGVAHICVTALGMGRVGTRNIPQHNTLVMSRESDPRAAEEFDKLIAKAA
jgi:hypothetical protein